MITTLKKLLILFCLFFSLFGTNAMSLRNSLDKLATSLNNLTASLQKQMPTRIPISTTGTSMPPRRIVLPPPTHIQHGEEGSASLFSRKSTITHKPISATETSMQPSRRVLLPTPTVFQPSEGSSASFGQKETNLPSKEDIKQAELDFPLLQQKQEESTSDDQITVLTVEVGEEGNTQQFELTQRDIDESGTLRHLQEDIEKAKHEPQEEEVIPIFGTNITPRAFEKWLEFVRVAKTPGIDLYDIWSEYLDANLDPQFLVELISTTNYLDNQPSLIFFTRLFGYYLTQAALDPSKWIEYEKVFDEFSGELIVEIVRASNIRQLWNEFTSQYIYNNPLLTPYRQYSIYNEKIAATSLNHNEDLVAITSNTGLTLWNIESGEKSELGNVGENAKLISFSSDDEFIAVGGPEQINVWNINNGQKFPQFINQRNFKTVKFSPQEDTKSSVRSLLTASDSGATIWHINTTELNQNSTPDIVFDVGAAKLEMAIFNHAGTQVATASGNTAKLWNAKNGSLITNLDHDSAVQYLLFSPNDALLATVSPSRSDTARIRFFSALGQSLGEIILPKKIYSIEFSPDSKRILVTPLDTLAQEFSVTERKELKRFKSPDNALVKQAIYSTNEKFIGLSTESKVFIQDAHTGTLLLSITLPSSKKILFNKNATHLIIQEAAAVSVWNIQDELKKQEIVRDLTLEQMVLIRLAAIQKKNNKFFAVPSHLNEAYKNLPHRIKDSFERALRPG